MPKIENGKFSRKRFGHHVSKAYFTKRLAHVSIPGFPTEATRYIVQSIWEDQVCFTRDIDEYPVKVLITYVIERIKECVHNPSMEEEYNDNKKRENKRKLQVRDVSRNVSMSWMQKKKSRTQKTLTTPLERKSDSL